MDGPRVAIIGAGASGLCMAIRLKRAGLSTFTLYERATDLGGTWRDNTYPGAGCDIPSHLYCYSFAPKHDWPRKYASQAEILSYLRGCAQRYGLGPHLHYGAEVVRAEWGGARWHLSLASGEEAEADFLVAATGQLSQPVLPDLPSLGGFQGASFHSARWDHGHDLRGEDVAVVGTGASAIQLVPEVARVARSLTIYQRTPNWVVPKPDRAFSRFEKAVFTCLPGTERLYRWLVYWTYEWRFAAFRHPGMGRALVGPLNALAARSLAGSPAARPEHPVGCKRILVSNDWFRTLRRPSVALVTDPIEAVTAHAVVAGGRARKADAIIFATGFHSTSFLGNMEVLGEGGRKLAEVWEEGAWAYLGVAVPRFPNLFFLYGPNTNLGHSSILFMVERQVAWALRRIRGGVPVDVDPAAAARYQAGVERRLEATVWSASCRSWYKTATGRVTNNWPSYTVRYWLETQRPRPGSLRLAGKEEQ
jgi:cation diffusion facilitator CzcD-associated flavoprotein CzcO